MIHQVVNLNFETMDKNQHEQGSQQQQSAGEQNPTLHEPGAKVADYGNVMGGSSDANVKQGQDSSNEERSGSDNNETMGNP